MHPRKLKTYFALLLVVGFANVSRAEEAVEGIDAPSEENIEANRLEIERLFPKQEPQLDFSKTSAILTKYNNLDPNHIVPQDLLEKALIYFDANQAGFANQNYITIVDFAKKSDKSRMFTIDMKTGEVSALHTTHGRGGDKDNDGFVETFSNVPNSLMSSVGYIRTGEIYKGTYGRAMRIDGLSTTNSNIRARAIVVHGWDDAHESNVIQGRSAGCFALDWAVTQDLIDKISGGSLMYAQKSAP